MLSDPQAAIDALAGLPLAYQLAEGFGQRYLVQGHRIQVVHQRTKALLQVIAMECQGLRGLLHPRRLVGHPAQQAGLGADARQVLPEVIVQGLRQPCALLLLHRQQGLSQLGIGGLGLGQLIQQPPAPAHRPADL
ncbi:hypothetical protein D3C80_1514090 [compost metagenome]